MLWNPIYDLLEDELTLLLANPQHIKALPGRKTDAKEAEWLADLLRHGLINSRFVFCREQGEQWELTYYNRSLIE